MDGSREEECGGRIEKEFGWMDGCLERWVDRGVFMNSLTDKWMDRWIVK